MNLDRLAEVTQESGCEKANRPYMVGFDPTVQAFFVFRPDCKCWNCRSCAARLRACWTKRVYEGIAGYIASGEDFRFVTVTSHERLYTFNQTLHVWPKAWSRLQRRVKYQRPGWHYVLIPEQHQNGRLHVHLIASTDLGTRWWKDNARACGLGWRAEEAEFKGDRADPARAASYAGKYMDKQLGVTQWPRYFHHIRTSQHFPELPADPDNPYDAIVWNAFPPSKFLNWLTTIDRQNQPIFYTGTGELIT